MFYNTSCTVLKKEVLCIIRVLQAFCQSVTSCISSKNITESSSSSQFEMLEIILSS